MRSYWQSIGKSGNKGIAGFVGEGDEVMPAFVFLFLSCIIVKERIDLGTYS